MNKKYFETKTGSLEDKITQIATEQQSIKKQEPNVKLTVEKTYFETKPGSISDVAAKIVSEGLDPVNKDAVKKDFKDRQDKDIDNDGDTDSTDKYLHKRRAAISRAVKEEAVAVYTDKNTRQVKSKKFKDETEAKNWFRKNNVAAGQITFKPASLLKKEEQEASCGCGPECDHCKGKHSMKEVGQECDCCGNKIKAVEKEAVDNPYAVGMAVAKKMKNDEPPLEKSTITKAHDIAKSIKKDEVKEEAKYPHKMYSKDGKEVEAKTPEDHEKYAKMGYTHKNETHSFMTKDMNKSKKDAKGEKEIVDPEPKLKQESIQDAIANVWKMSAEELEKIKTEAKYMKAQRMSQYKAEDEKNKKGTADTGSKATKVDVEPSVDYKN